MTAPRNGFTLFELLVVLVILAITASAAIPVYSATAAGTPERQVASHIADALADARNSARETGRAAVFVLSPSDGRYWITARDSSVDGSIAIPPGTHIDGSGRARIEVRFDPAGTASPLSLSVSGATDSAIVSVDRWSGDVRVAGKVR